MGGYPYWSWYGFNGRVEWCACFVSWCYNQMGLSEPRFAGCTSGGMGWFTSHGQWGDRNTVEGNSGDACKIKSYPLGSSVIRGYGLMNWD